MTQIRYACTLPIKYDVDIFVAGGGPSGLAAAVTSARQGARVFLAEGQACFGGMGTSAGLPMFCAPTDGVHVTSAGFGADVYERLIAAGGTAPETRSKPLGTFDLFFNCEILKRVYDDLAQASGMQFSFHTQFLDVVVESGAVTHAICAAKSGVFAVRARLFVDATGDGDLCARAGAPFEKGDANGAMQPPTLVSLWCDIDWDKANREGCGVWRQEGHLPRAFQDKVFTIEDRHLPGMVPIGPHAGGGNIGHLYGIDGTDEVSLTKALLHGRQLLLEYARFYREYLSGYEQMQLLGTGALLGVRETRRITGDYVLSLPDFQRRAVFPDEIGRFSYPVDIHPAQPDSKLFAAFQHEMHDLSYKPGENYGIPYRCLTPIGLNNVLVAGRCISCDRCIQGSLRVMPGCFITGQAAGMAATLAAEQGVTTRQVSVTELQARLAKMGAFLPNRDRPCYV